MTALRPAVEVALGVGLVFALLAAGLVVLGIVEERRMPGDWQAVRPPDDVSALLVDRGLVYAGGSGGLFLIEAGSGRPVAVPEEGPTIGQVGGIVRDRAGGVWVAHDRGIALYANGTREDRTPPAGVGPRRVMAVVADSDGRVWAGGEGGIACLENGTWTAAEPPGGWPFPSIDVLYADDAGTLWAGSRSPTNGGLCRFDGESWAFLTDELPHATVNAIAGGSGGAVYVGTGYGDRGGLALYRNGTWSALSVADGLPGPNVRSVFEDSGGRLWVGSEYDGLAVLGGRERCLLRREDGLLADEVKVVAEDDGGFWLGTARGLMWVPAQPYTG